MSIDYYFEQDQQFLALVHDSDMFDQPTISLKDAKYIGEANFKIQNIV